MNKKPMIFVSVVAAIPAAGLLYLLGSGLLQGMLADGTSVSVALWIVWGLAVLGCLVISFLPFAIAFFPGLLPEPATAGAAVGESAIGDSSTGTSTRNADGDDGSDEGEEEFDEATSGTADGEQLFEAGALEDDFEDDFGDSFADEDAKPRKKGK